MEKIPTIKGIFVMSHVDALERVAGEEGMAELVRRMGRRVRYGSNDDVPVREEIEILEHVHDIVSGKPSYPRERSVGAGRLHFKNFSETPLGEVILALTNFKTALLKSGWIAGRVFRGIEFIPEELGDRSVRIIMKNNDYAIDHFKGFFEAWMESSGLHGSVTASDKKESGYEYVLLWE
jgi:uncharacterized protein (TIGR02265 family)